MALAQACTGGAGRPAGWLGRVIQQDWYLALARYRWYVAVSAGAGAMALASGVILLLPHQPGRASDVLVLEPASAGAQLAPGGRVSVVFFAAGQTASPASCSFNGTAC